MKYLKTHETYTKEQEPIELKLGEHITLKSMKSLRIPYKVANREDDEYNVFTKAREIEIFINNKLTGKLYIDERHFNTLRDIQHNIPNLSEEELKFVNQEVKKFLLMCHQDMKMSNPLYGTYDSLNRNKTKEGKLPLLTDKFFEYVEKTFNSPAGDYFRDILKDLPMYISANKYNL